MAPTPQKGDCKPENTIRQVISDRTSLTADNGRLEEALTNQILVS